MKKLLVILFVLASVFAEAQTFISSYQVYGTLNDTLTVPSALRSRGWLAVKGDTLYAWSLGQQRWIVASATGGGGGFTPSGTSAQYIRGNGTYATFPTAVSAFTNDANYLSTTTGYTQTQINSFFGGTTVIGGYNKTQWDAAYGWGNHAGLYPTIARFNDSLNVHWLAIQGMSGGAGVGDMTKAIYDTDNDGDVDDAELLAGQNTAYYLNRSNHTGSQAQSTITNLVSDLAGKAATSHVHNASTDITTGTLPIARGGLGLSSIGTAGQQIRVATGGTTLEYFTPNYATTSDLSGYVPTTRTVNGLPLSSNITLNADNVSATATNLYVTSAEKTTWNGKQAALGFTPENVANKATSLASPSNLTYPTTLAVADAIASAGGGDMLKSTYDTDNDGDVDDADALNGQIASYYLNRANHTGEQAQSTITGLVAALAALQPLDADLTGIAGLTGNGLLRKTAGVWGMDATAYLTSADLSPYLTSATAATTYVPVTRTINGTALSSNITLTTANITESGNLYFTENRVRLTPLTGYTVGTNTVLSASDDIVTAFGKVQAQLNNKLTSADLSGYLLSSTAASTYQTLANLSNNTSLGSSTTLYPTQNAVKVYVDAAIAGAGGYTDEAAQDAVGAMVSSEFTYTDATPSLTINTIAASKITQNSTNRFVTDAEKTTWNTKEPALGNPSTNGYILSSTTAGVRSWIPAATGTGTVTSASVVSANGFAGSVANASTTPAITLSTTVTGLLKGNGTAISGAVAGTDYVAPNAAITAATNKTKFSVDAKGLITATGDATTSDISEGSNLYYTDTRVRAAALTGLSTATTTTVLATDNIVAGMGKLQGQINALPSTSNVLLKANNLSDLASASTARTNLGGTTVGSNLFTLTNPSAITFPRFNADNTVSALDAATFRTAIGAGIGNGNGTVTNLTVTTANGVSGSVATSTTTPAITLTLGAITPSSVAASGTVTGSNLSGTNTGDQFTNTTSQRLLGRYAGTAGAAQEITLGSGLTLNSTTGVLTSSGGTIDATPTNGSTNAVQSDGVFDALALKQDAATAATLTGTQTLTNKTISGANNTLTNIAQSSVTNLTSDLALKASLASPALTGTPTVPTATAGTNTTQAASTAFVQNAINSINLETSDLGSGGIAPVVARNNVLNIRKIVAGDNVTIDTTASGGLEISSSGGGVADSIQEAANDAAATGNVYINTTTKRMKYKIGGYWYSVAITDSTAATGGGGGGGSTTFVDFTGADITESPEGTWTRAGSGNRYLNSSQSIGASEDGSVQMKYEGSANVGSVLGLDPSSSVIDYSLMDYGFYISGGNWVPVDGGVIQSAAGSATVGTHARINRSGSTFTLQTSATGTGSWTTIYTYSGTSTAQLYPKMDLTVADGVASQVKGTNIE